MTSEFRSERTDAGESDSLHDLPDIVARIVESMRKGQIDRLSLTKGDFQLDLRTGSQTAERDRTPTAAPQTHVEPPVTSAGSAGTEYTITSPMIGTFYVSPAPGELPFVRPGDKLIQGQTVGIVEAMKIMNEIVADRAGTVSEILAEDGETVEYGSPLIRVEINA